MLIAGEASGDLLAAELVRALREECASTVAVSTTDYQPLHASLEPGFFGVGGPRMAVAGVELALDLTAHSVIGFSEALRHCVKFWRLLRQVCQLAIEREPDAIICVDFGFFNGLFAREISRYFRSRQDWFHDWAPKLIRYVSPQVWASREDRAYKLARDYDLLLSTFAFEKEWYAKRVPKLRVEFVGNPVMERYAGLLAGRTAPSANRPKDTPAAGARVVLLPGSRRGELRRHIPVLMEAASRIAAERPAQFSMVLPSEPLAEYARSFGNHCETVKVQVGQLEEALAGADLAITKSGTITLECACFGVPAVVLYKTSAANYLVARWLATVKHLAMPNLLAEEEIYPEFVQGNATPKKIARAALELLGDETRRQRVKARLAEVVGTLGGPGASRRAARAIVRLLEPTANLR